jgi:hypothetical protein
VAALWWTISASVRRVASPVSSHSRSAAHRAWGVGTARLAAAAAWPVAFLRLVVVLAGALARPAGAALAASPPGRAAGALGRALARRAAAAWSWVGPTVRIVTVPLLPAAHLVRAAWRAVARVTAPARQALAGSSVGLSVAAAWQRGGTAATRLVAPGPAGPGAGARDIRRPALAVVACTALLAGGTLFGLAGSGGPVTAAARTATHARLAPRATLKPDVAAINTSTMARMVSAAESSEDAPLNLPAATAAPAPAPPSLATQPPLQPHEVFGFAPYWTLSQSTGFDVNGLTTIAYFSIGVNADGSLAETGSGWDGYESQAFADLVTRAHAAGDRVVLTVNCFGQTTLNELTSSATAPATLSSAIVQAIEAKNLDGVNIDFEGEGSGDQEGLTNLVTRVSAAVHQANPHYQVTMDTYASSAGDPTGFYNIRALAPAVDGFFVMAYQLNLQASQSPASPLTSSMFSDLTTAEQYAAVVPTSKVILGVPYYGYDWPTDNGTMAAEATGTPTPVTYGQVVASGHPVYWDPVTDTAWSSFQVGGQWHEDYFEDPASLYLVAQMAQLFKLDGLGVWALGMDGNSPQMLAALDGLAQPVKSTSTGPAATSTSGGPTAPTSTTTTTTVPGSTTTTTAAAPTTTTTAPGSTTTVPAGTGAAALRYSGLWKGQTVALTYEKGGGHAATGSPTYLGQLIGFQTNDPAAACLESAAGLPVWQFGADTARDVVVAEQPTDCVSADFTFPAPATAAGSGAGTGTGPPTGTGQGSGTAGGASPPSGTGSSSPSASDRPRRGP